MKRNKVIALTSLVVCLICLVLPPIAAAQALSVADNASLEARIAALEATVRGLVELLAQDGGYSDQSFQAFAESLGIDVSTLAPGRRDEGEDEHTQREDERDDDEQEWEEQGEWEGEHPAKVKPGMQPM